MICHGPSTNWFSTEWLNPLEEAGYRVLMPSRPGCGRTPLSVGRTAAEAATALAALLDCLGIASCSVIAVSGGGPTQVCHAQ